MTLNWIGDKMDVLDKFFTKYSYKFPKGYPDMKDVQDILLMESILESLDIKFPKKTLIEKSLAWSDLSNESRKYYRLTTIANKIADGTPFTLENGNEEILTFTDPSYTDLFVNQKVDDIRNVGGRSINNFKFFKDSKGNEYSFKEIKKTKELGGTGGSKPETTERQEKGLIDAINKFPEKPFTLVGANGEKIKEVTGARKMPNPLEGEAYTDVVVETIGGDINLSAKGTSSPNIAGGGLKMASNLGPEVEDFIQNFYEDAYEYYKDIFNREPEVDYNTNLYKTPYFKDVNRVVPKDIMKTILVGIERFGGPVDGYYIGPMTIESVIKGGELHTNGDIIPIDKFLEDFPTIYAYIKKRDGDYYFIDKTKPIPSNKDIIVPMLFANSPVGNTSKSRFGMNFKPRGKVII